MGVWYGCLTFTLHYCTHGITNRYVFQKYQLYDWGHDQSLMIRPEDEDADKSCKPPSAAAMGFRNESWLTHLHLQDLTFFNTADCSGNPLLIFPPASILREKPVAGCTNYAASGITSMSYRVVK